MNGTPSEFDELLNGVASELDAVLQLEVVASSASAQSNYFCVHILLTAHYQLVIKAGCLCLSRKGYTLHITKVKI